MLERLVIAVALVVALGTVAIATQQVVDHVSIKLKLMTGNYR